MSARSQSRLDRLLEYAPNMPPAELPLSPDHLVLISAAWMICSYSGTPGKHGIKRLFNRTLRDMAHRWGFSDVALRAERPRKDRPTILFASEIMHSKHVQYRYFGQYLRQLRTRFEVVLLTEAKEVDDAVRQLFDRVLTFDRSAPRYLHDIYRMMVETAPDILFYPSVGMRHWGPLFANLRLAPIQLTALGHSASSFCDTVDYYLLEEGYVSDPSLFGETVITVPDESLVFERMPGFTPPAPEIRTAPDVLRVVLPSNLLKLNPNFLATIAKIRAGTRRRIQFHLLPNARGSELAALRIAVQRFLPDAQLHGSMAYERYVGLLSSGDLNLSPFPFGGLHSVVDSLRQGVPVVAMDCPEPHGRTDAMLLRRLGMPEWLIAQNEDEYIAAALRVIEDDGLRVALSEQALAIDVGRVMFGDDTTPLRSEIVETMWWLYENHERAQADGRKLWSLSDRQALAD
jgi:predicted O-linked N-acetylglucosamine transferase (SPINDLY family)